MELRQCAGCVYKTPERDDPLRPNAIATTTESLRVWQCRAMLPDLIGLPIYINHSINMTLTDPATGQTVRPELQQAVTGNRPLGTVTHAWMNAANSVFWAGVLRFQPEDRDLLCMYTCGLMPECSLQHTIRDVFRTHVITPIEISICHRGRRPGSDIYIGGDVEAYMRNTGYTAIRPMSDLQIPAGADIIIQCANKVASKKITKCVLTVLV